MSTISLAMWIVAAILFLIDGWILWRPPTNQPGTPWLTSLGLFFLTLGFILGAWH